MAVFSFRQEQHIPATTEAVWDFMSSPGNLKRITPPYMGFDIVSENATAKMYPGMIIRYKVSPLFGIKLNWVTEITHVNEPFYFVDEQRSGPYRIWHHQHFIETIPGGVKMVDIVHYQPPFGFLGNIANAILIRSKLEEIFNYRRKEIETHFGKWQD